MKRLFCFQVEPSGCYRARALWVYATHHNEARNKLVARMEEDYPKGFKILPNRVKVYADPRHANNNANGGLLSQLSPGDKADFVNDFVDFCDSQGKRTKEEIRRDAFYNQCRSTLNLMHGRLRELNLCETT